MHKGLTDKDFGMSCFSLVISSSSKFVCKRMTTSAISSIIDRFWWRAEVIVIKVAMYEADLVIILVSNFQVC